MSYSVYEFLNQVAQFNRLKYLLVEQADMGSNPIAIGGGNTGVSSIHGSNLVGSTPALPKKWNYKY